MTETSTLRVNITSATADLKKDQWGETIAEVPWDLPSNIVTDNTITSATMMVTKAKMSLANIPAVTTPVRYVNFDDTQTNMHVMVIPGFIDSRTKQFIAEENVFFNTLDDIVGRVVRVYPENYGEIPNAKDLENQQGYHKFRSISDFLRTISQTIERNIRDNSSATNIMDKLSFFNFQVESDNTISLVVTPTSEANIPVPYHYFLHNYWDSSREYSTDAILTFHNGQQQDDHLPSCYGICVNKALKDKLYTLPWIKTTKSHLGSNWDEDFGYILDTSTANFSTIANTTIPLKRARNAGSSSWTNTSASYCLKYNFIESDAISLNDVNSICLTMSGASLTNQILPVNFPSTQKQAAQTTSIPIIEYYHINWNHPSDTTTDFLIKQDNVTNGAPIRIHPSLLKERNITFKAYYITNSGEMREMTIPSSTIISFQLTFEITRKH